MATKKITTEEKKDVKATSKLIISPRVTEKASMLSSQNAYTFVVVPSATKLALLAEIKATYKVTPTKITIAKIPRQYTFIRGKLGTTAGMKKAIVFLKKGDTITFA
jgi:large subunit ribosomal protein L23